MKNKNYVGLIITDTHLQDKTVEVNRSVFSQAIQIAKDNGIEKIYHGGDIFESRSSQTQQMLMCFDSILESIHSEGLELIAIPGNHDKTNYLSHDSFLHTYRYHPLMTLVTDNYSSDIEGTNLTIHMIPFFSEQSKLYRDNLEKISERLDTSRTNILITHIGINGAIMNDGVKIEDSLTQKGFDMFDYVYVGHFHDRQSLKGGKIQYIGSAYQGNYGEDTQKGVSLILEDGSVEFIKLKFPEYKRVDINLEDDTVDVIELVDKHKNSKDHVRFVFSGSKEALSTINKSDYVSVGIDVKTKEFEGDIKDYTDQKVETFNSTLIKNEWEEFTKDTPEVYELGKTYLEQI